MVHTVERLPHTHVEINVRRSSGRRRPVRYFIVNKINGFRSSSDIRGRLFFYTYTIVAGWKNKLHTPIGTLNIIANIRGAHKSHGYDRYYIRVRRDLKRTGGGRDDKKRSADAHILTASYETARTLNNNEFVGIYRSVRCSLLKVLSNRTQKTAKHPKMTIGWWMQ